MPCDRPPALHSQRPSAASPYPHAGLIWKRPYADMSNLSWLRRHATELQAQQQFMAASSGDGMPRSNGTPVQVRRTSTYQAILTAPCR